MALWVRLYEKLTGRPHQHMVAHQVSRVAGDLQKQTKKLKDQLEPYTQCDDPLVQLMTDVFNDRQFRDREKKKNGDGRD